MRSLVIISICVVKCLAMSRSELEEFSNFLEVTSQLDLNVKSKGPDDDYDEEESISDDAWEESGKFEGDLILNERQRRLLVAEVAEGLSRNGLQDSTKRWPNNEVIYYIQREHFSSGQAQAIQAGIDDLAQVSCVKFTPYTRGDRDAVVIQGNRRGCFSQVGYQGGYQVLNLSGRHPVGRGCFRHGTIVHELLHSLGFYHMQSSPDRDDYIDVLWQNIIKPARHNFRKYNSFAVNDFGVGYDYESVLHYSRKAFSSNGQDTLVPKQLGAQIGQRIGMSQKDVQKLNRMYCDADSNDSNNADDDSAPKKPVVNKKKPKNKPFDGHGIGYDKGKTVIIKLEPTAGLYRLTTLPTLHTLDVTNAKQVLPRTFTDIGVGEKKVITSANIDKYFNSPTNRMLIQQAKKDEEDFNTKLAKLSVEDNKAMKLLNDINEKNSASIDQRGFKALSDEISSDIAMAFEKISKIVQPQFDPTDMIYLIKDSGKYYSPNNFLKQRSELIPMEFKHFHNRFGRNQNIASFFPLSHTSLYENKYRETYPFRNYNFDPYVSNVPDY